MGRGRYQMEQAFVFDNVIAAVPGLFLEAGRQSLVKENNPEGGKGEGFCTCLECLFPA